MGKLMVIAVDVDDGKIHGIKTDGSLTKPFRIVGFDRDYFDQLVENAIENKKAEEAQPHQKNGPAKPELVCNILHTHQSPGCVWVCTPEGWCFCYS